MTFLKKNKYVLSFGILQIFFSAPGQTFLIAIFVTPIFGDIGVSLSLFAGIYSLATLAGALCLNIAGRLIDRFPLKTILLGNMVGMSVGCLLLATSTNLITCFIAFFILRFVGQGVFLLTASTTLAKVFHKNRGKALGFMTLGFPLSEAIYPSIVWALFLAIGWRWTYGVLAVSNLILMYPVLSLLVHKANLKKGHLLPGEAVIQPERLSGIQEEPSVQGVVHYSLKQVIKDPLLYLVLAASCFPPLLMTGLLFHQETLFRLHQWPIAMIPAGLGIYALFKAIGSVGIGPVIDRYGPLWPFVALIVLLGLGTLLAGVGGKIIIIYGYFALMGMALGFSGPVMNVIWPNLYGTKNLGSIKGYTSTYRNGITAFGPLPLAIAMDFGYSMPSLLILSGVIVISCSVIPLIVQYRAPRMNGLVVDK